MGLGVRQEIEASLFWPTGDVPVEQEASKNMHLHRRLASIRSARYSALLVALLWTGIVPGAYAEDGFVNDGASGCAVFKPNLKAREAVAWQGACANGQASGPGIVKWTAGDGSSLTFEGTFAQGKLQGEGGMTASGGDRYVGSYKDGKRDGPGTYLSANQDRFEGRYKDNQRHGHGILTLASGQRLEGEWANGVQVAAPAASVPTTPPSVAGAAAALAQAPPPRQEATPQPSASSQAHADPAPLQVTPPVLTPRQQAQQQQQQLERQKAQEERAAQQLALQQQQREQQAERRRAFERQQKIDRILFWLFMVSPVLLATLVWQLKSRHAVAASDGLGGWVDRREAKARDKSGYFANFVEQPFMWCSRKIFELTSSIIDQFLKAGVRLALWSYLFGLLIFLAYVVTVAVIAIAIVVVFFYVLPESVTHSRSDRFQVAV